MTEEKRIAIVTEEDLNRIRDDYEQLMGRMQRAEDDLNRFWLKATLISAVVCVLCCEVFGHLGELIGSVLL